MDMVVVVVVVLILAFHGIYTSSADISRVKPLREATT